MKKAKFKFSRSSIYPKRDDVTGVLVLNTTCRKQLLALKLRVNALLAAIGSHGERASEFGLMETTNWLLIVDAFIEYVKGFSLRICWCRRDLRFHSLAVIFISHAVDRSRQPENWCREAIHLSCWSESLIQRTKGSKHAGLVNGNERNSLIPRSKASAGLGRCQLEVKRKRWTLV